MINSLLWRHSFTLNADEKKFLRNIKEDLRNHRKLMEKQDAGCTVCKTAAATPWALLGLHLRARPRPRQRASMSAGPRTSGAILASLPCWPPSAIQDAMGCSRATVAKIAKRDHQAA
jgi:hypothetical protein